MVADKGDEVAGGGKLAVAVGRRQFLGRDRPDDVG